MRVVLAGPTELAEHGLVATPDRDIGSLRLAYDDIVRERDRLRSARASVTRQLGPLPASAGIAISVVGALATGRVDSGWLIVALVLLVLLVVISILFSLLPPYRRLRAQFEDELTRETAGGQATRPIARTGEHKLGFDVNLPEELWLRHMVDLERRIYGPLCTSRRAFRHPFGITNLQDGFNAERTGLYLVQLLFVALIAALVVGLLVGR
jgi:hypothetical protein